MQGFGEEGSESPRTDQLPVEDFQDPIADWATRDDPLRTDPGMFGYLIGLDVNDVDRC